MQVGAYFVSEYQLQVFTAKVQYINRFECFRSSIFCSFVDISTNQVGKGNKTCIPTLSV